MGTELDELRAWVILHRAEVPPRFAHQVRAMGGARELIRRGELVDEATGKLHRWDFAGAAAEVSRWFPKWPWPHGRILGGPTPESLGAWVEPPLIAYARGGVRLDALAPAVAIVGTRAPSRRGVQVAEALARDVVAAGGTVISGGAIGIDCAAHEAALAAGGRTVVVMGQPLRPGNRFEKGRLGKLLADHPERALALFCWAPWVKVQKFVWSARNRFIAGLSRAVVVVQGREQSGTRYTADGARSLGIPVWAVPGDADDPLAALPNALIGRGRARPLDAGGAVGQLVPDGAPEAIAAIARRQRPAAQLALPVHADPLLAAIAAQGGRALVDNLAKALQKPPRQVLVEAAQHELAGRLRREGPWLTMVMVRSC